MVIEADGNATILRCVEDVFDYLADPRNEPEWLAGGPVCDADERR